MFHDLSNRILSIKDQMTTVIGEEPNTIYIGDYAYKLLLSETKVKSIRSIHGMKVKIKDECAKGAVYLIHERIKDE